MIKCVANRESFGRAVEIAAYGGRPVEIEVAGERAVVRGTDPDVFVEVGFEAEAACSGIVSVPSKRLAQIAKELNDDQLLLFVVSEPKPELTAEGDFRTLVVEGRRASFRLGLFAQRRGKSRLGVGGDEEFRTEQIAADKLCEAIERTLFAAGDRCGGYDLSGVYFDSGERLEVVATSGTQMVACELECSGKLGSGIVPIPTAKAIRTVFRDSKTPVLIAIEHGAVVVTGNCGTVSSRLIPSRYPRWREAIDISDAYETIEVDPKALNRSLRLAMTCAGMGRRAAADFEVCDNAIRIEARSEEFGSVVEVPVLRRCFEKNVSVGLPIAQLTEFLGHVSEPLSVTFGSSPASPVVFAANGYRYAVSSFTE